MALTVATWLVLAAPAGASWTSPVDTGVDQPPPRFAANGRGDRVMAWSDPGGGLRVSVARPGKPFGRPRAVPGDAHAFSEAPHLAVSPAGDALIAWSYGDGTRAPDPNNFRDEGCCEGVKAVVLTAAGRFGRPQALAPRGNSTFFGGMAIASASRFVTVFAAAREDGPGGQFERVAAGRARFAGRRPIRSFTGLIDDVSYAGSTVRILHSRGSTVYETTRGANGRYGRSRPVFRAQSPVPNLEVGTDRHGDQVGISHGTAIMRRPGRAFSAQRITNVGRIALPRLAVASNGAAALAWPLLDGTVRVATRQPGRRFNATQTVFTAARPTKGAVDEVAVAVDRAGRATVVWMTGPESTDVMVVTTSRGGRLASTETITTVNPYLSAFVASRDDRGRGTILWTSTNRFWASYGS